MMAYDYQQQKPQFYSRYFYQYEEFGTLKTNARYPKIPHKTPHTPNAFGKAMSGASARTTVFPPSKYTNTFDVDDHQIDGSVAASSAAFWAFLITNELTY